MLSVELENKINQLSLCHGGRPGFQVGVCFITAGPITKLFAWGGGGEWRTCAMRDDEPRPVWMNLLITHKLARFAAGPGAGGVCFITAGPITKLFAWGEEESGGHVL